MAIQNGDNCYFSEAEQEWDLKRLFDDIEANQPKMLTPAQKRNLKAILLGLSPSDASRILHIERTSLKSAFSLLYRIIEDLVDHPETSITYKNASRILKNYRKGEAIAPDIKFELLGRDVDRQKLEELRNQYKIVLIKAGAGVGKSTLAQEFLKMHFQKVIEINLALSVDENVPASERLPAILKELNQEISNSFALNLDCLKKRLLDRNQPSVAFLIDNLEPALDNNFRFLEKLNNYEALLSVLGDRDVFSFTLITSRRSLIAQRVKVHEYLLDGLDIKAWWQYFHDCENGADSEALLQMHDAYKGNAKAMDILQSTIKSRFNGNIGAYWSQYKDALLADSELETLISVEMDWLRDNQPDAYKLLCRMGCYRYQDVKTVPFEGLICLLWDVHESQRIGVINYLSKTSLIEVKGEYYLHPAIRNATKFRLMENKVDWETANKKAAFFWLDTSLPIESSSDAIRQIEFFEHYYCISAWEEAFLAIKSVCIKSLGYLRHCGYPHLLLEKMNRLERKLSSEKRIHVCVDLGISLYYLSKYKEAITYLDIDHHLYKQNFCLDNGVSVLRWLCACYLDMGNLSLALKYGNRSICLIREAKEPQDMEIHVLNLIGSIHSNLCNYKVALENHHLALDKATSQNDKNQIGYSSAYIAYCKFFKADFFQDFKETDTMTTLLKKAINIFHEIDDISSEVIAKCFLVRLHLQNKDIELAKKIYTSASSANKDLIRKTCFASPYLQNTLLTTLAKLHFVTQELVTAIDLYRQSIVVCEGMEAKFLLAESIFQLGLTYQAMGEHDQAEEYKAKALELFAQMEAPRQIERVNKAFEQGAM